MKPKYKFMEQYSMVKGPIILRGKKLPPSETEFDFELTFTDQQKAGFIAELICGHIENNTLTVLHKHETDNSTRVKEIRDILSSYPDMSDELKDFFLKKLGELV